jgi:hypothetical protein
MVVAKLPSVIVPEPLRWFFEMWREIVRHLLDCENVRGPAMMEGCLCLPEDFTEQDASRLRAAQNKLRQLGT